MTANSFRQRLEAVLRTTVRELHALSEGDVQAIAARVERDAIKNGFTEAARARMSDDLVTVLATIGADEFELGRARGRAGRPVQQKMLA